MLRMILTTDEILVNQDQKKGSESNFDVTVLCADVMVVLNLNPTPISLLLA